MERLIMLIDKAIKSGNPQNAYSLLVNPDTPKEYHQSLADVIVESEDKMYNKWCAKGLAFGSSRFPPNLDRTQFLPIVLHPLIDQQFYHLLGSKGFVTCDNGRIWQYRKRLTTMNGVFMPTYHEGEGFVSQYGTTKLFGKIKNLRKPKQIEAYKHTADFHVSSFSVYDDILKVLE